MDDRVIARFGNWIVTDSDHIDRDPNSTPGVYPISVSQIPDARAAIEWIAQLSEKTWMTPDEIGNFVKAMDRAVCLRALAHPLEDEEPAPSKISA